MFDSEFEELKTAYTKRNGLTDEEASNKIFTAIYEETARTTSKDLRRSFFAATTKDDYKTVYGFVGKTVKEGLRKRTDSALVCVSSAGMNGIC